jgi:GNAT superfamily N-acetyltransferase
MPDMLVKLYELPDLAPVMTQQIAQGIDIRRSMPPERHIVVNWVRQHFSSAWASETDITYSRMPVSCFVAVENEQLIGFGCYDATHKGFFGPTGVQESERGRGIGKALLLACLHALYAEGYGYAIIGAAGPTGFYEKAVKATAIPDSWPGVYRGMLRDQP